MAFEELRAENVRLRQEMYLADQMREADRKAAENERKAAAAAAVAVAPKLTEKQIFHNRIISNPVVVGAVSAMKEMFACTLWWVVQWGNEYLARFKASATAEEAAVLKSYKNWTQTTNQKREAEFEHISTKPESQPSSAKKAAPASPFVDSD